MLMFVQNCVFHVTMNLLRRILCRRHILILVILSALQFLVLLPAICHLLPFPSYSPNFQITFTKKDLLKTVSTLNRGRVERSKHYFKRQNKREVTRYYHSLLGTKQIYMSVAIITINRSHEFTDSLGYLMQSAAALDSLARSSNFQNRTFFFICNVDTKPGTHSDATCKYLPFTERYGASSFDIYNAVIPGTTITFKEKLNNETYDKETYDYMYCLKVAQSLNSKYSLMVEDDAIAHKDLSQVLKFYLDDHSSLKRQKQFVFLKLYYPIKWQGFAFEIVSILELISIGVIGGGLSVLCVYVSSSFYQRKVSIRTYQGYFIAGIIFLMLNAEMLGRQNVLDIRRLSRYLYQLRRSPGCCTQAMLYPSSIVDPLLDHLTSVSPSTHTDLAIEDFVNRTNIPAYQLEPNLFYHVGMYTSLKLKNKSPEEFLFYLS